MMRFTVRPIRFFYLVVCLSIGLIIAHFNHPYVAVSVSFALGQFDINLPG